MTEEEYDLKNVKLAKRRKYTLLILILTFVLTSFLTAFYVGFMGLLLNLTCCLFFGVLFASNSIGSKLTSQTSLQWIFSFSSPLLVALTLLLSDYLIESFSDNTNSLFKNIIVKVNSLSFALSIGFGIYASFDAEIERVAKLIRLSKPERENILKIESSELNSN